MFTVEFPGFAAFGADGSNAQVSAFGLTNARCQLASWGNESAKVRCFNIFGNPVNVAFSVMLAHPDSNDEALAYVWSNSASSSSFTPSPFWAYKTGDGDITGVRNARGT